MFNYSEKNKVLIRLISSTAIAQVIPFAISPILTRLYSPSDFGYFSFFCSLVAVFAVWANGRFELAIVLGRQKKVSIALFYIGLLFSFSVCLLLLILGVILKNYLINIGFGEFTFPLLSFYIVVVLGVSSNSLFNYYLTKLERFKTIGNALIGKAIIISILQIVFGFFELGGEGLVLAWFLAFLSSSILMYMYGAKNELPFQGLGARKLYVFFKAYIRFPFFSAPASLLSTISSQANNLLIPFVFSMSTLGLYSLAERLLSAPITLIGNSISQVYFKAISSDPNNAMVEFKSALLKLSIISILIFFVVQLFANSLFVLLFGDEWAGAANIAKLFSIQFCVQLIISPLLVTLQIYKKNKIELLLQFLMCLTYMSVYLVAYIYAWSFLELAKCLSLLVAFNYFVIGAYLYSLVKKNMRL
ncbi:oligosaccharide flippase family protein [Pseudoalteromonas rhizosphaerae]|uniref:oligosaccharide flippase family protein n=1 Tax=Pseudoalteromonas rhizosphaerae TaxID=2518973 RepID=UPI002148A04B|nr:oligosaccharide flippase family protein [Pseudoalteromonas rhizosphaerae]